MGDGQVEHAQLPAHRVARELVGAAERGLARLAQVVVERGRVGRSERPGPGAAAGVMPRPEVADRHDEGVVRGLPVVGEDALADRLRGAGDVERVGEGGVDAVGRQHEDVARLASSSVAGFTAAARARARRAASASEPFGPRRRRVAAEHAALDVADAEPGHPARRRRRRRPG